MLYKSKLFLSLQAVSYVLGSSYVGPWRYSLDSCWTQNASSCNRALTIVHGGDWTLSYPYDSFPAFERGYENQADAVKGDFRVNEENIGMVMHSSPVEIWESPNCWGKKVEEMTTEECESCKMAATNYTFISAPELLEWSESKVNVMFCIKKDSDIPRAISTLIENNASHRAFLEVGLGSFINTIKSEIPSWDQVYYIIEVSSSEDIQQLASLDTKVLERAILIEFQKYWQWGDSLKKDIDTVHYLGLRSVGVTYANPLTATMSQHLEIFNSGFDVVYTYNLDNAANARTQINSQRGLQNP